MAQDLIIAESQGGVARFVVIQTGQGPHVEDLCQNVFVRMLLSFPKLRSPEKFESWLVHIARNVCIDYLRQRQGWERVFVPMSHDHEAVAAPDGASGADGIAPILTHSPILDQMPAVDRQLLSLSLTDITYAEMGKATDLSVSAVKARLFRVRRALKRAMNK